MNQYVYFIFSCNSGGTVTMFNCAEKSQQPSATITSGKMENFNAFNAFALHSAYVSQ